MGKHTEYRPLIEDRAAVYDKEGEPVFRPVNLGWLLLHWVDVAKFDVTNIYKTDAIANPDHWDCALIATLRDGRKFATPFASKSVLLDWLDRPRFRGLPLRWFGYHGVAGGEKYRSQYIDYKVWR
jgi:hypothetical protein